MAEAGDFNFPETDWEAEVSHAPDPHNSHSFLEVIRDHFLFQHVNRSTYFRFDEGTNVLDLILTSKEGMVCGLENHLGLGKSDHMVLIYNGQVSRYQI